MLQQVFDAAGEVGLPVTFTLLVLNAGDPLWPEAITMVEKANAAAATSPHRCSPGRSG